MQGSYDASLSIFLRQTRKPKKFVVHDYFFRNFETSFGFFKLRLCRVIDLVSGETHRVLPDIVLPNATNCIDVLTGTISTFHEWLLVHPLNWIFVEQDVVLLQWKHRKLLLVIEMAEN